MQIPGYRIIRKINQGGMSTVYLAIQVSVGREVALKVMSPIFNADPVFSQRFQREANIVGQLSHPNIVSIYDIGCYKNLNYIAMDYLPGGSVHDKMRDGLSTTEALTITRQVARALDVAHEKGYVHRDIKPENILFREDGTAVLSDFGVAKIVSAASRVTNAGTVVGTPHYMSPEQSRGLPIDGRSDIYSLGIVFYEMLTGVVPFQAEEAVAIAIKHLTSPVPTLPGQHSIFQNMLKKLLAKSPKDRYQSGAELIDAIESMEQTLSGYPNRRTPFTDPSDMNVMTLLRALIITSYAAIRIRLGEIGANLSGWRWTPNRGFYLHPNSKVTKIRTEVDSVEDQRETIISTRIQKAAYYEEVAAKKLGFITRGFMLLFVLSLIWSAISVGFVRYNVPSDKFLPAIVHGFIVSTANVVGEYADNAMGNDTNLKATSTNNTISNDIQRDRARSTKAIPDGNDSRVKYEPTSLSKPPVEVGVQQKQLNKETEKEIDFAAIESIEETVVESPKPAAQTYALTISIQPEDARIRILNIRDKYEAGMQLKAGRYSIEISKPGFHTIKEWQRIRNQNLDLQYQLKPDYQVGDVIIDALQDGSNGPEMVIIPTGSFEMGKQGVAAASPVRTVTLSKNIAVSKYETTFAQYQKFIESKSLDLPNDAKWGRGSRPVINVSWQDAVDFAAWLSMQSGFNYRLPTEAEWEFFARAGMESDYWWGDQEPGALANCKRGCDSDYAGTFSSKSAPVGSFPENPFSLHDTSGNVAEWVADCFQNHYSGAPIDGSAVDQGNCELGVVRGGAMNDNFRELYNYARQGLNKSSKSKTIGFRLVREIK